MITTEQQYLDALSTIFHGGYETSDRTGVGTITSADPIMIKVNNPAEKFPLLTTKYVSFNMLMAEMLWFISGSTNTTDLAKLGSPAMKKMWDNWATPEGDLGPVYGAQLSGQLQPTLDNLLTNPESRRHVISLWNPEQLHLMKLPPCHGIHIQFTCQPVPSQGTYKLHLTMTQRSADFFLGVPFNIPAYSAFLLMVSRYTGYIPGNFTWMGVNCHVYSNHKEAVLKQLSNPTHPEPNLIIKDSAPKHKQNITLYKLYDFEVQNYEHSGKIKAPVAI
jgi:thymidylate synthase